MRGASPPPDGERQRRATRRWVARAVALLFVGLAASSPQAAALSSNVHGAQASGPGWTNPTNALTADADYASTTQSGAALAISGFLTSGFSGPIQAVSLRLDQSQPNHLDDEFTVTASDAAGCNASPSWSATVTPTASRSVASVSLSCPAGWTWARVQSLAVHIEATPNVLVDGEFRVHYAYLQVTYTNANPVANAGADQSVAEGTHVALDGTASGDADGDAIAFLWSQTAGLNVALGNRESAVATFTAPALSSGQQVQLEFQLRVTDTVGNSATDTLRVTVQNANLAPLADAGADRSVAAGAAVTLDGSRSRDPDSDPLTYQWTQTYGPSVALSDRTASLPSFTAPTTATTLEFALVVTDNSGVRSDADLVAVFVAGSTEAPPPLDDGDANGGATDDANDASAGTGDDEDGAGDDGSGEASGPPVALRLEPARLVLGPEGSATVRAVAYDADGDRVPIATCSWDDGESGGSLDGDEPSTSCTRTFRAGERLGTTYRLVAKHATGAGLLTAGAPVIVAALAGPADDASSDGSAGDGGDEPVRCSATVDPRSGPREMPVGFADGCSLEMVVLEWRERPEALVRLVADPVAEWPDDLPAPPGRKVPGRIIDVHVEDADGEALETERATIHFTVPRSWLASDCPAATCEVRLFHFHDGRWDSLAAEKVDEDDDEVEYQAETESFSLFVPGGVPIAGAGSRGGGFDWGQAAAWIGLVASALLLALFFVKRFTGGRAPARTVTETIPLPSALPPSAPASSGPSGGASGGRPAAAPVVLRPQPLDLVPVVRAAVAHYAPRAEASGVAVDVAADAVSLPVVADRAQLGNVTLLLLDLAARTAGKAGSVDVRVREQDGFAVVEFEEEPGIAWSADVARPVPAVDLTGAARVVDAHRGRLWSSNGGRSHRWGFAVPLRTAADALAENEDSG